MKQHISNTLRGFAFGLAASGLGAVLIAMMLALYDVPRTVHLAFAPWAAALLVIAIASEFLYARGSNLLVYAAASTAVLLLIGNRVVSATVFDPASSGFPLFLRFLVFLSGYVCAYAVYALPGSDWFVRMGDAQILLLACYLFFCSLLSDAVIIPILGFAICALCLTLLTAALLRAGAESDRVVRGAGTGGLLILGAVFGLCVLAVSALLSLASGRIDSLVGLLLALWKRAVAVASWLFERFVRFIALFAPKPVQYNMTLMQEEGPAVINSGLEVTTKMPQWAVYLVMALIGAVILAAVLGVLYMLRRTKLVRRQKKNPRRVTRTSRMLEAILARIRQLREAIAFELLYRANRRTPQGLYVLAVRACRLSRKRKRPSESPGAFIRRLHAQLLEASGMSTLDALADKLDRALYAGETVHLSHGESDAFAAQIQAVRQISLNNNKPASP